MGEMITQRKTAFISVLRNQAAFCRTVSISFSQEMMRFQVGMLWDAKFLSI